MQLILDRGKGEDVIVTHDQNTITFRANQDKFKSLSHIDLSQLSELGTVSKVIDLEKYLVLLINSRSIWIQKSDWQMVEEPGSTDELLGLFDHHNQIVKITDSCIQILDDSLNVLSTEPLSNSAISIQKCQNTLIFSDFSNSLILANLNNLQQKQRIKFDNEIRCFSVH